MGASVDRSWDVGLSKRDAALLRRAASLLEGTAEDMGEALRALTEAVVSAIPNGRVYVLARGPAIVLGSIVSGVGIAEGRDGVLVERVDGSGMRSALGRLRGGT